VASDATHYEVVYALDQEQLILPVAGSAGMTVQQAIEQSGMQERFPEIDLAVNKVGVFGKLAKLDDVLNPGDRVEIYRPLIADPKEARKKRAAQGKVMKKGAASANTAKDEGGSS
jgi:putative ubiquitin-RnfH superfamily antitoxin RatB of RatAB toxin-antitoxin module